MLSNLLGSMSIIAGVVYILILILGIYICKKTSFIEGVYFFSILTLYQICSYFLPYYFNKLVTYYLHNTDQLPLGMSIGELLAFYSIIGLILKAMPFLILVYGLYRRWKVGMNKPKGMGGV